MVFSMLNIGFPKPRKGCEKYVVYYLDKGREKHDV